MKDHRVVLVTCSNSIEAERISKELLKKKLVACVNIISSVRSFFIWKGKIEKESESLLIIKTRKEKIEALIQLIKKIHSYSIPEMITLPIVEGNEEYLEWIDNSILKSLKDGQK